MLADELLEPLYCLNEEDSAQLVRLYVGRSNGSQCLSLSASKIRTSALLKSFTDPLAASVDRLLVDEVVLALSSVGPALFETP